MYDSVEAILNEVLATDGRFIRLCRDCRGIALAKGESEGIAHARMLLRCARQRQEEKRTAARTGWIIEHWNEARHNRQEAE